MQADAGFKTGIELRRLPPFGSGGNPDTPYAALAGIQLMGAAGSALLGLVPGPSGNIVDWWAPVLMTVLAGLTWFGFRRMPAGLDVSVLLAASLTIAAAMSTGSPESQVVAGLGVMVLAMFAAYSLPLKRAMIEMAVMLLGYAVAIGVFSSILHPVYVIVVMLLTSTVSVSIAALVGLLREQAVTDALTGVLNRRGLAAVAEPLRAQARRVGSAVSVALIDVDDFKSYNDRNGHLAGDRLLKEVADCLQQNLRASDVVARFGGDEFAVVLPGADAAAARLLLSRVQHPRATWSTGVANWVSSQSIDDVLAEADRQLYQAKQRR